MSEPRRWELEKNGCRTNPSFGRKITSQAFKMKIDPAGPVFFVPPAIGLSPGVRPGPSGRVGFFVFGLLHRKAPAIARERRKSQLL